MRTLARLSVVLAASSLLAVPTGAEAPSSFDDPIRGVGHGAAFGADGREIAVTAEFIAAAQALYTARALQRAGVLQLARHASTRSHLDGLALGAVTPADRQGALLAGSLLLERVLDDVRPADAALLRQRNRVLMSFIRRGLPYLPGLAYAAQPHQVAQWRQAGLPVAAALGVPTPEVLQARETYAKRCRKAGVPIPPTWGKTGAGFWVSQGAASSPFISQALTAEVYVYESARPEGVCVALPRYGAGAAAPNELLGIICQGVESSKACFWDNQLNDVVQPIPRTGEFPLNTSFAAGEELEGGGGGVCTACHAGENAYIIHPDDPPFDNIPKRDPKAYYTPIVAPASAGWPQNDTPNTKLDTVVLGAGDESCLSCHFQGDAGRLPEIVRALSTGAYCDAVLGNAIARTMPPAGAASAPYKKHTDFLIAECNRVRPP